VARGPAAPRSSGADCPVAAGAIEQSALAALSAVNASRRSIVTPSSGKVYVDPCHLAAQVGRLPQDNDNTPTASSELVAPGKDVAYALV
jgi:hypothetical protein